MYYFNSQLLFIVVFIDVLKVPIEYDTLPG